MKKINNKGVTLIELIVSFAIVGVAMIYFFQTLYTVKKIYSTARDETQKFVDKDYALRIISTYIDNKGVSNIDEVCDKYDLKCAEISKIKSNNEKIYGFNVLMKNGENIILYKYLNSELNNLDDSSDYIEDEDDLFDEDLEEDEDDIIEEE